jgi:hypothetical protein
MLKKVRSIRATLGVVLVLAGCGTEPRPAPRPDAASADAAIAATDVPVDRAGAADAPATPDGAAPTPDARADAAAPDAPGDLAADGATDAGADAGLRDAALGDTTAPDAGPALALTIGRFELSGELCPEGSTTVSTSPDAFTVIFSEATFAGEGPRTSLTRTCRVAMELGVPAGYQFSSARFLARGGVFSQVPAGTVLFDHRFSFEGRRDSAFFSSDLSGGDDDFLVVRRPVDLWSPSCDGSSRVRLLIDLTATVQGGNDLFALDALDGAFAVPDGLEWRRCGEIEPIRPPPSGKGGPCDGVNKLQCLFGLICEFAGENVELGSCIDPTEVVPPQPTGEQCGGYRAIPCADGLVCMFASPRSVAEKRLGFCTPASGNQGDSCGGHPPVPCAAGLTCNPQGKRCVRDDGELGSPCGEGLRACNAGLTCNNSTCAVPRAGEGQPCGGPTNIQCRAN